MVAVVEAAAMVAVVETAVAAAVADRRRLREGAGYASCAFPAAATSMATARSSQCAGSRRDCAGRTARLSRNVGLASHREVAAA